MKLIIALISQLLLSVAYLLIVIVILPIDQYDRLTIYFYPSIYFILNIVIAIGLYKLNKSKSIYIGFGMSGVLASVFILFVLILLTSSFNR